VITDLGNGRVAGQQAIVPTPSCIRARRVTADQAVLGSAGRVPAPRGGAAQQLAASPAQAGATIAAIALAGNGSGRGTARAALDAVLSGVRLGGRDRQFLSRLVQWDKRNAASVASLIWRARQAGRQEAALTPRQLEVVLSALSDAALYRGSGTAAAGCWDCEIIPGGRCAEHAKDNDRARAYAELAASLSGNTVLTDSAVLADSALLAGGALLASGQEGMLPQPRDIAGYRKRAPVAS
jgi:hypothetical protein